MPALPISQVRDHLGDLGNIVALRGDRIVIERRGKDLCALVSIEDLSLLEQLEDKLDLETLRDRMGEPTTPWEQVRKELGL